MGTPLAQQRLVLDHIRQVERHTKCNNFYARASCAQCTQLAHQQSTNIIFTPTQEEPARPLCLRSKAPNKVTFLVAVRQAVFYCYNAKLDAPSRYGLMTDIMTTISAGFSNYFLLFVIWLHFLKMAKQNV